MCLVRSLVAYRYLARAGVQPELHVGFERSVGGLRGNAWVMVNGAPVTDLARRDRLVDAVDGVCGTYSIAPQD